LGGKKKPCPEMNGGEIVESTKRVKKRRNAAPSMKKKGGRQKVKSKNCHDKGEQREGENEDERKDGVSGPRETKPGMGHTKKNP